MPIKLTEALMKLVPNERVEWIEALIRVGACWSMRRDKPLDSHWTSIDREGGDVKRDNVQLHTRLIMLSLPPWGRKVCSESMRVIAWWLVISCDFLSSHVIDRFLAPVYLSSLVGKRQASLIRGMCEGGISTGRAIVLVARAILVKH